MPVMWLTELDLFHIFRFFTVTWLQCDMHCFLTLFFTIENVCCDFVCRDQLFVRYSVVTFLICETPISEWNIYSLFQFFGQYIKCEYVIVLENNSLNTVTPLIVEKSVVFSVVQTFPPSCLVSDIRIISSLLRQMSVEMLRMSRQIYVALLYSKVVCIVKEVIWKCCGRASGWNRA
jgi:hypothetical protein